MININKNQILFETPYVVLRTDQSFMTTRNISIPKKEESKESEKLLSIIFGYPYLENPSK